MNLRCLFGHDWNGCTCSKCQHTRDEAHDWSKDCAKCARCGKRPDHVHYAFTGDAHDWSKNCEKCARCGKPRVNFTEGALRMSGHDWKGSECARCGLVDNTEPLKQMLRERGLHKRFCRVYRAACMALCGDDQRTLGNTGCKTTGNRRSQLKDRAETAMLEVANEAMRSAPPLDFKAAASRLSTLPNLPVQAVLWWLTADGYTLDSETDEKLMLWFQSCDQFVAEPIPTVLSYQMEIELLNWGAVRPRGDERAFQAALQMERDLRCGVFWALEGDINPQDERTSWREWRREHSTR